MSPWVGREPLRWPTKDSSYPAVDNTKYAPLGEGYPSAAAALQAAGRPIPLAVVGAGIGGDCVPPDANYSKFYNAVGDACPAWRVVVGDTGHFAFLDERSSLMAAICAEGRASPDAVRAATQAVMVCWGELFVRAPDPQEEQGSAWPAGTPGPERAPADHARTKALLPSRAAAVSATQALKLTTLAVGNTLGVADEAVVWGRNRAAAKRLPELESVFKGL